MLLDVVSVVGWGEDFRFVDVVYANGFEDLFGKLLSFEFLVGGQRAYLAFDKVTNSCLCHDWDCDSCHDLLDHLRVRHACHPSLSSDICRHSLESHDCNCAGLLCYSCLTWGEPLYQCLEGKGIHTCSAFTTSIMTPPFNIRANPVLTVKLASPFLPLLSPLVA